MKKKKRIRKTINVNPNLSLVSSKKRKSVEYGQIGRKTIRNKFYTFPICPATSRIWPTKNKRS